MPASPRPERGVASAAGHRREAAVASCPAESATLVRRGVSPRRARSGRSAWRSASSSRGDHVPWRSALSRSQRSSRGVSPRRVAAIAPVAFRLVEVTADRWRDLTRRRRALGSAILSLRRSRSQLDKPRAARELASRPTEPRAHHSSVIDAQNRTHAVVALGAIVSPHDRESSPDLTIVTSPQTSISRHGLPKHHLLKN